MGKEFTVKKLSNYNGADSVQILSRLNRITLESYAEDEKFASKLRVEFAKYDEASPGEAKLLLLLGIIDLIANSAPDLFSELIAIMCEEDIKEISEANALDIIDAVLILGVDIKLMDSMAD